MEYDMGKEFEELMSEKFTQPFYWKKFRSVSTCPSDIQKEKDIDFWVGNSDDTIEEKIKTIHPMPNEYVSTYGYRGPDEFILIEEKQSKYSKGWIHASEAKWLYWWFFKLRNTHQYLMGQDPKWEPTKLHIFDMQQLKMWWSLQDKSIYRKVSTERGALNYEIQARDFSKKMGWIHTI
jgi:hypothetical protein